MAVKKGHGAGKHKPHPEVLPPAYLPDGLPVKEPEPTVALNFREDGTIADSETAKAIGRLGGLARARKMTLLNNLGLKKIAEDKDFYSYHLWAKDFVTLHSAQLASISGGWLGAAASTIIASAGLQAAASRMCTDKFAQTGDYTLMKMGSDFANQSRQNLLAAHELNIKMAIGMNASSSVDPLAAFDGK